MEGSYTLKAAKARKTAATLCNTPQPLAATAPAGIPAAPIRKPRKNLQSIRVKMFRDQAVYMLQALVPRFADTHKTGDGVREWRSFATASGGERGAV